MDKSKGTPKTLCEAIENGLKERGSVLTPYQVEIISADIESHVKDFLAQKFGGSMLESDESVVQELWIRITGK